MCVAGVFRAVSLHTRRICTMFVALSVRQRSYNSLPNIPSWQTSTPRTGPNKRRPNRNPMINEYTETVIGIVAGIIATAMLHARTVFPVQMIHPPMVTAPSNRAKPLHLTNVRVIAPEFAPEIVTIASGVATDAAAATATDAVAASPPSAL